MQQASIVYNPAAHNAPTRERLLAAAAPLEVQGWRVELRATESEGHAIRLAREAASRGDSVVFACGGDGTINEVVNGLAGSETALAVLRAGMGNVFAKEIGVSRSVKSALRVLVDGVRLRFDLGMAGERYFLMMAGVGFDAHVVTKVPSRLKKALGSTSYAMLALRELPRYRTVATELKLSEEAWAGGMFWTLLGNTRSYGGILDITRDAIADDGLLDAYVFAGSSLAWQASTVMKLVRHRQDGAPGVAFRRVNTLDVDTPGIPVQADGEYLGETPMRFSVAPGALQVLAPRGKVDRLLGTTAGLTVSKDG